MLLNGWKGLDFSLLLKMTSGFSRISRVFSAFGSKPIFAAFQSWPLQKQPLWRHNVKTCARTESKLLRILTKRALIPVSTDLLRVPNHQFSESWTFGPNAQSRIKKCLVVTSGYRERSPVALVYFLGKERRSLRMTKILVLSENLRSWHRQPKLHRPILTSSSHCFYFEFGASTVLVFQFDATLRISPYLSALGSLIITLCCSCK